MRLVIRWQRRAPSSLSAEQAMMAIITFFKLNSKF